MNQGQFDGETSLPSDTLSRPIHVTVWKSAGASEKFGGLTTMNDLAAAIRSRSARSKEELWWLKLAKFGDVRTEKGSLRHNENVTQVEGLEADYDGGEMSFEEALEIALKSGVALIVYTSPSHTKEKPRWRVLAPFSQAMDPDMRDRMMGRLNGLFKGIFARESWVLSQSYYYGCVNGNEANHRVEVFEGVGIDEADELDEIWMAKTQQKPRFGESEEPSFANQWREDALDVDAIIRSIVTDKAYHNNIVSLVAHCLGKGLGPDEAKQQVTDILDAVPVGERDRRWRLRRADRHIDAIVEWVWAREKKKLFRREQDKKARQEDARTEEPPSSEEANPEAEPEPQPSAGKQTKQPVTVTNILTLRRALARFPKMSGFVAFNELTLAPVLMKPIPDPDRRDNNEFVPRAWEDNDDVRLALWFQSIGYLKANKLLAHDVMQLKAAENAFHPVQDYLSSLTWDGVPRLSDWLRRYAGAVMEDEEHAEYIEAVSRAVLIGAVARAYKPGCKLDTMAILEGAQGALKSSMIRALVADPDWFSDTMPADLEHKDARQHLRGNWIIEMSEIAALRKSEVEGLKAFLSTQVDKYRPSHGRSEVSRKRQCLFIGTTNEEAYLIDATGNRRFWPVKVTRIDLEAVTANRDQLWAEAVAAYRNGEAWWLSGAAAAYAIRAQDERLVDDAWASPIGDYLRMHPGPVEVRNILKEALSIEMGFQNAAEQARVVRVLKGMGYTRNSKSKVGGRMVRSWSPPVAPP